MDGVMRLFWFSGLVVSGVILLGLPGSVNSQPPSSCDPSPCVEKSGLSIRAGKAAAKKALKRYPDIQARIKKLEAESLLEAGEASTIKRCKCNNKCKQKKVKLEACYGCIIFWPFTAVTTVTCVQKSCKLGCDCKGRCTLMGRRLQWVLLYCPKEKPRPFKWEQITLCSKCCCRNVNWWQSG